MCIAVNDTGVGRPPATRARGLRGAPAGRLPPPDAVIVRARMAAFARFAVAATLFVGVLAPPAGVPG